MMKRATIVRWAAALGGLGVLAGAFGAHALEGDLSPDRMQAWRTGAHYQQLHALALLGVAGIHPRLARPARPAMAFIIGTLVFSGSLYALCLTEVSKFAALTPLGGVALIVGWGMLGVEARGREPVSG